ncbi:hypothetical protein [Gloeobacter morelensis]|uniref:Uncharacterized protein n=1 Tax=Gloeobacter morelensis MG652769 TaxID=2781736 RepID=A0ABY3PI76_9CYAN|nr:hypothetical protein [Gloeobacter morelensis]UFP93350.1 hypothetical protein ISF26_16295 [Gloeobacter morelensis MG652769]
MKCSCVDPLLSTSSLPTIPSSLAVRLQALSLALLVFLLANGFFLAACTRPL